ncbi:hypothetical protein VZC37_12450 [Gordonia sp. LSe1-13]|uniref:DUF8020 domain-containing protein n=1 Tax=Gordonia sesuvii TaxID=3116777 RepID=A0ABU7MDM8_9ACTN|nr:hypothetical protein [Gordonia sp. LSe1-13]
MKRIHRYLLAIAAITVASVAIPSATANAAPASPSAPFVNAGIAADGQGVVAKLRDAVFVPNAAGSELQVVDRGGRVVDAMPLVGTMDGFSVPLRWSVSADRSTATFVPQVSSQYRALLDRAATDAAQRKRITKAQRYDMMWAELNKGWNAETQLSTVVGGLIGYFVGAFIPFGWLPGAVIGAGIGAYIAYERVNPKAWPSVLAWWNTP